MIGAPSAPWSVAINAPSRRAARGALLLFVLLALGGCELPAISVETGATGTDQVGVPPPPPLDTSRSQLAELTVAPAGTMRGYSREKFPHWSEQDGNCSTREVVLKRDGADVAVGDDCYPTRGRWFSVYDGRWLDEPGAVDIDHMVPLANAWRSGASAWTDGEREVFANDLERGQLIAVSAGSNRAKGDQDPSQWRPSNTGVWCDYARWWIDVKHHYRLRITEPEKAALSEMLTGC